MKKIMFNDKFGLTQAVLEGRKTMTRRVIACPHKWHGFEVSGFSVNKYSSGKIIDITLIGEDGGSIIDGGRNLGMILPKYKIGEVVAVAQSYESMANSGYLDIMLESSSKFKIEYCGHGYTNKMFVKADLMPHRIKITDIKVERIQDISDEDCLKEGVRETHFEYYNGKRIPSGYTYEQTLSIKHEYRNPRESFAALIDKVSGRGAWDSNPYVFAYSFELIK